MKKMLAWILVVAMLLSMAACGGEETPSGNQGGSQQQQQGGNQGDSQNNDQGSSQSGNQGGSQGSTQSGGSLGSVTVDNAAKTSEEIFGAAVTAPAGWTITEAYSPNGVNNLTVKMTSSGESDGKAIIQEYFDKTLALGGVYQMKIDWDTLAISKGTQYTDFETFCNAEVTNFDTFYSALWLYDFGSKCVEFSISLDGGVMEIDQCFVTLNQEIDYNPPSIGTGPEGWTWREDYGWIDGVWDSDVLPENFPAEISGVKVDDTWYYGYGCDNRFNTSVGDLYFEDYEFEEWELSFWATDDQLAAFQQALADHGFVGSDGTWFDDIDITMTDGEIYLYYTVDECDDKEGYQWEVWCDMTYIESQFPAKFEGIDLPQLGMFDNDPLAEFMGWDEEFNEVEVKYDFDKGTGEIPAYHRLWLDYFGVTLDEYMEYLDYLKTEVLSDQTEADWDEYSYDDTYCFFFERNGDYYVLYYQYDNADYTLTFATASYREDLSY